MPMYSFFCPNCGKHFEELLSMKDKDFALCPDCGTRGERNWMGKRNFIKRQKRPHVRTQAAAVRAPAPTRAENNIRRHSL